MSFFTPQFGLAMAFVVLMGFALQRGGTCTVAAIDEILLHRRSARMLALMETALWVFSGLLILWSTHLIEQPLQSWEISTGTFLGALLLGLGAVINGACIVGTMARIGNFEWTFSFTLLGFFLGAWFFYALDFHHYLPIEQASTQRELIPLWAMMVILVAMILRLWHYRKRIWHLRMSTILIGVSALFLMLLYGPWAFTDFFIDVAKNKADLEFAPRLLLFVGLLCGTLWGGFTSKLPRPIHRTSLKNIIKCLMGGILMGIGSVMIPGSHDSLILFYLPLLLPFAWLAFITMIATIAGMKFWMHQRALQK
jgi:toxin CptA